MLYELQSLASMDANGSPVTCTLLHSILHVVKTTVYQSSHCITIWSYYVGSYFEYF